VWVREEERDESERRGSRQCLAEALHEATRDEHARVGRRATECGCDREECDTDEEQLPTAEDVGETSAKKQEPARHQHIAIDDPRQAGITEAEILLDLGQRNVHDGDVENEHELNQREHRECLPAARVWPSKGILHFGNHCDTSRSSLGEAVTCFRQVRRICCAGFDS